MNCILCMYITSEQALDRNGLTGHSEIKGNKRADTLAKQANLPQPDVPVPYNTAAQMIQF